MVTFLKCLICGQFLLVASLLIAIRYHVVFRKPNSSRSRRLLRALRECYQAFVEFNRLSVLLGIKLFLLVAFVFLAYCHFGPDHVHLDLDLTGAADLTALLCRSYVAQLTLQCALPFIGSAAIRIRRLIPRLPEVTQQVKNFFWRAMAGFTTLLVIGMAFLLFGCSSLYERAHLRYAKTKVDTIYTRVEAVVPRDSVVHVFKTDTTRLVEKVKQGRATVTIIREPTNTTVIANCDSARVTKTDTSLVPTETWGVDPTYKQQAETRLSIIYGLSAFIGLMVIVFVLSRHYQFTVTKKTNGSGAAA